MNTKTCKGQRDRSVKQNYTYNKPSDAEIERYYSSADGNDKMRLSLASLQRLNKCFYILKRATGGQVNNLNIVSVFLFIAQKEGCTVNEIHEHLEGVPKPTAYRLIKNLTEDEKGNCPLVYCENKAGVLTYYLTKKGKQTAVAICKIVDSTDTE